MSKKLRLNFSYSFSGQIWRLLTEAETGIIVAETRDGNQRKTDFAAIYQNKLLYESVPLPETWWISAVALQQGILLLQTFPDSQTPVPKGILALDVRSANIIWQHPQLNYAGFSILQSAVIATESTNDGQIYRLINLKTGKTSDLARYSPLDETGISADSKIIFPRHYTSENKYFPAIVSFLNQKLGIKAEKAVDYAEYQHLLIISYYLYDHNTLSNFLVVIDRQTGILLHESIATQLSGTGLDTFCIMNNHLIFVREKKELLSYEL
ncbi:DUF4905 domain-containing protein [Rhodocytophaga rosea]|uniref:DUF4905 domain-containing protein n=1 Tax=Rhodocytophaga rosea TaxID=2704465 RepID=A0A6C0GKW2_9BACT|nr:DUF4905 domain-containing protein [Rhodocytophaga rosea]QHT68280.1 DUF4905 domain-containing protein [Rhodocytophaga rosea]